MKKKKPIVEVEHWVDVQLNCTLPTDIAVELAEVCEANSDFLRNAIIYCITRREIFHKIREQRRPT